MAVILSANWPGTETPGDVDSQVGWLRDLMERACDFSMTRAKPRPRRAAYWWTEEIAELRRISVLAKRRFTRSRRRDLADETEKALKDYKEARKAFSEAIKEAKAEAWDEQLLTLDSDPWGRPYKIVIEKIKLWTLPVTESLDLEVLEDTLSTLFPKAERAPELYIREPVEWSEDFKVTDDEMAGCIKRLRTRGNKAPGPDGIPGRVWVIALAHLSEPVGQLLTQCLREGYFPQSERGSMWSSSQRGAGRRELPRRTGQYVCRTRSARYSKE